MNFSIIKFLLAVSIALPSLHCHCSPYKIGDLSIPFGVKQSLKNSIIYHNKFGKKFIDYVKAVRGSEIRKNGGKEMRVVVFDNKIDANHPYLKSVLTCVDKDDGFAYKKDADCHGTHIAGIIHNLAPKASIYFVTYGKSSKPEYESFYLYQLNMIAKLDADVVNISLGLFLHDQSFRRYSKIRAALKNITDTGKIVFMAAGNDGGKIRESLEYLRCLANEDVFRNRLIVVGSCTYKFGDKERMSGFSDHFMGKTKNFVVAPGENIFSAVDRPKRDGSYLIPSTYDTLSGTSMASPVVAGCFLSIASKIRSIYGKKAMTNDEVLKCLIETCRSISFNKTIGFSTRYGHGVVDAEAAYRLAEKKLKPKSKRLNPVNIFKF